MNTTWILAADASRARIFEEIKDGGLRELEDLVNPAGREEDHEISSDAKGRYFGKGEQSQGHTAEPHVQTIEHEVHMFSKRVGEYLERAHSEQRYDKLCVIAPPKFLGLLRNNIDEQTRRTVSEEIPKDIAWFSEHEVEEYVKSLRH